MVSWQQCSPLLRRSVQILRILSLSAFGTGAFVLGGWLSYHRVLDVPISPSSVRAVRPAGSIPRLDSQDFPAIAPMAASPSPASAPMAASPSPASAPVAAGAIAAPPPPPAASPSPAARPRGRGRYRTPIRNPGHSIPAAFRGKVIRRIAIANPQKVVALTFDDGPWPQHTEEILNILKQFNARATFFVTGVRVQRMPVLARRMVSEGHAIGNHTWNHPDHQVTAQRAVREIEDTRRVIQQATGIRPVLYRPPGGNLRTRLVDYVQHQQEAVVMWSVDTQDYRTGSESIVQTAIRQVRPGAIVLMHDGGGDRTATVAALPRILTALKQQGYRFVTVPELLAMQKKG